MTTDYAAPMTLDRSDASATAALYRAAIGPVQLDYYLKTFTRFDATGKVGPCWNWGAALVTLNWMAFHRLWGPALVYVGASVAAILLLFGILPLLYPLSHAGLWTMQALILSVAVAVPGAFGNAWLYAACSKAMDDAYSTSATQEEACALLRRRAVGRQRLGGLAAGNATLIAAVATIVLSWPGVGSLPLNSNRMEQARMQPASLPTAAAPEPAPAPVTAATTAASAPRMDAIDSAATAPASDSVSAQAAAAGVTSRSSQGLVQMPAPIASTAPAANAMATAARAKAAAAEQRAAAQEEQDRAIAKQKSDSALAAAAAQRAAALASRRAAQEEQASRIAAKEIAVRKAAQDEQLSRIAAKEEIASRKAQTAKAAKAAQTAKAATVAKAAAPVSAAGADQYLVNVGVFADTNNARNAYTKLRDAGLPAQSMPVTTPKGERTRVRVGPFESRAEADTAADKIRALSLEAMVFKP